MTIRSPTRGYSLVELGLVMSVGIILVTAAAVSSRVAMEGARIKRTTEELDGLSRATAAALHRGLQTAPGAPGVGTALQRPFTYLGQPLPRCYDLAQSSPGVAPRCPDNGAAVPGWSPAAGVPLQPLANELPGSPLRVILTGGSSQPGGFNAWCLPYIVCLFGPRVDVLTCVPVDDTGVGPVLQSVTQCGAAGCPLSPLTGEQTTCVVASAASVSAASDRLRFSYPPESYAAQPPPIFAPGPPSP